MQHTAACTVGLARGGRPQRNARFGVRLCVSVHMSVCPPSLSNVSAVRGQQGRRQVKQSGVDSMGGVWSKVSPRKSGGRVDWGYNLKLSVRSTTTQSQKHPREKVGWACPPIAVHPVATPLAANVRFGPLLRGPIYLFVYFQKYVVPVSPPVQYVRSVTGSHGRSSMATEAAVGL